MKDLDQLMKEAAARAPLGELVDIMDVGFLCAYLVTLGAPPHRRDAVCRRRRSYLEEW